MQKTSILLGAIFLACTAQAQSTDGSNNNATDTTHRYGMHRNWGHRDGSDSMHRGDWNRYSRGGDRQGGDRQDGDRLDRDGRGGGEGFRHFGHVGGGWAGSGMGRDGAHRLHYTPEQRRQIRDINTDYHKKATDLFKNDNLTLRQYKAGLIALQKDKKSKMQALLTPQQKEQVAKGKQRMAENAQVMAAARMERLKIRLGLSDQQVATLKTKEEALRSQLKAIHENDDLLPQQKMEQFKELIGKRKEIIKSVLTPEQQTKFSEMESAREGREHRPMPMMHDEGK
jgi:Spy/CpxP family protein refolding chaperone